MTLPESPTQPSLDHLRTVAYLNQRTWVQRVGALDSLGRPCDLYLANDLLAVRTGSSGALMLPVRPTGTPPDLPNALTWLRQSGSGDVLIWAATPHRQLDRWLSAQGARESFAPLWMSRSLDQPLPPPPSDPVAVVRAARPSDLPELLRRVDIPYFSTWQAHATIHLSNRDTSDPSVQLFIALVGDEIVGRAVMNVCSTPIGHVAGFYDVGVAPQWQRRGIGRQMIRALLVAARQVHARYATLNATPAGEAIYREAGFRESGTGQTWTLPAVTLRHPPASDLVRFAMMVSGGDELDGMDGLARSELANGDTPLAHAARFEQPASARQLMDLGTIPDVAALWQLGLTDDAQRLMAHPGALDTLRGTQKVTPLHIAIHWGDLEFVEALLDAGADPRIRDGTFDSDGWGWCHALGNDEALSLLNTRFPGNEAT